MRLSDIAKITEGKLIGRDIKVKGFSIDSRKVKGGECFIAIKGNRYDGHDFVSQAVKNGAVSALVSKIVDAEMPQVLVNDTVKALQRIAIFKRNLFKGKVIGIVGSAGKTTTKDLIHFVLNRYGKAERTEGNLNSRIGLPLCMANMSINSDFWVLEHGASALGDIKELAEITKPHIGVITAIGEEHLETFESLECVLKGNLEITSYMDKSGILVVPFYIKNKLNFPQRIITFGRGGDIEASDVFINYEGTRFRLMGREIFIPVVSVAIVDNVLACAGVLKALNKNILDMVPILKDFKPTKGRMRLIKAREDFIVIDDSYNSNPLSLRNALITLSLFPLKKIAILGDMLELGKYSEELHRDVGRLLKNLNIDYVIFFGRDMKYAWEETKKLGVCAKYIEIKADIVAEIKEMGKEGMVVLVKGSRSMAMEDIVNYLLQGD